MSFEVLPIPSSNDRLFNEKAIKIQSLYRGYKVRQLLKDNFLPKQLRIPCNALLSENLLKAMPKSNAGDSDVYFPTQIPEVVLKEPAISRKPTCSAYYRLRLMCYARKLCQLNGFTSLVIPKALLSNSQKFLFEERIPFNSNFIEQERLATIYAQDDAIKQFTRFVLETGMWDISLEQRGVEDDFPVVKTDNFPFYVSRTNAGAELHIGMIDLEHISTKKTESHHRLLLQLVYAFPNSFDLIVAEARSYGIDDSQLQELNEGLVSQRNLGLQRNKLWYTDLIRYLDNKRQSGMDMRTLLESKRKVIFSEMVTELQIPEEAKAEFSAYFEKFCSLLIEINSKNKNYKSVYGENHINLNSAEFSLPLLDYRRAFENKDETHYLEHSMFLKKMVEHQVIYHFFERGYYLNITC